jgi:hypothetical protein
MAIPTHGKVERIIPWEVSSGQRDKTAVRHEADFDAGGTYAPTAKMGPTRKKSVPMGALNKEEDGKFANHDDLPWSAEWL